MRLTDIALLNFRRRKGMTVIKVTYSESCAAYASRTMSIADGKVM